VGGGGDGTLVEPVGSFLRRQSLAISVLPPLGVHIYNYARFTSGFYNFISSLV
ncbi:unnamed protein product, partial [Ixodes pacificus]